MAQDKRWQTCFCNDISHRKSLSRACNPKQDLRIFLFFQTSAQLIYGLRLITGRLKRSMKVKLALRKDSHNYLFYPILAVVMRQYTLHLSERATPAMLGYVRSCWAMF